MATSDIVVTPITPLARPVSTRLRSALVIPTLPQILNELVQNSLDAGAKHIVCWLDLSRGHESLRVEDDGHGLTREAMARVGERYVSSKDRNNQVHTPLSGYGFRGEALASIADLGLLSISTKTASSRQTYSKLLKGSKVLAHGRATRAVSGRHGTVVTVKDLFHKIPVRQASMAATPSTTIIGQCKRVVETLALVHPGVDWTLWEERNEGTSAMNEPKKIVSLKAGLTSLVQYRAIYGSALVERVQNIRVSSDKRRLDGFISLQGSISRSSQFLYVNKFPIDRGELHTAISKRIAASRFSFMTQDDVEDPTISHSRRKSPRRADRYPIYVLNLTIPPEEVDAVYEPSKRVLGLGDTASVQSFILAVIDEYLKRNGFAGSHHSAEAGPASSPTLSRRASLIKPARPPITPLSQHFAQSVDRTMAPPSSIPSKRPAPNSALEFRSGRTLKSPPSRKGSQAEEQRSRAHLLDEILASTTRNVFPVTPSALVPFTPTLPPSSGSGRRRCSHRSTTPIVDTADVRFNTDALQTARIIGQVDKKYIACLLGVNGGDDPSLVLIDQHAADERVAVEAILRELCEGFATRSIKVTETKDTHIILTAFEAAQVSDQAVLGLFARWGIGLELPETPSTGNYVQIGVKTVPSVLAYRLARKEGNRPISNYIETSLSGEGLPWQVIQRWMPKEMLDLVNSKACRNAIMFEDPLDLEQCQRLVCRLSQTDSPWICAHGRPSLVPLGVVARPPSRASRIDWSSWSSQ